ncbi:hypothetical protein ART_1177 [Arthrobacter sp. PAMC 25486]|nr:hypothetical protein ART_1177 [Arthrobacter sp. PAMC 25486]
MDSGPCGLYVLGQDKLWAVHQAELGAVCSEGAAQLVPLIVESLRKGSGSAQKPSCRSHPE